MEVRDPVRAPERMVDFSSTKLVVAKPIVLTWAEPWTDGDCELAGPRNPAGLTGPVVTFNADGTGIFQARGRSTDDDDTWVYRLEVLDAAGALLFHLPGLIHVPPFPDLPGVWTFDLPDPGNWYDGTRNFMFPAAMFARIHSVSPLAAC